MPFYFGNLTLILDLDPYLVCDVMNSSRSRFKQSLRFSNDDRADALANKLLLNYNVRFWKEVSKMNRTFSNVLLSTINGVTGENNITTV